MTKDAFPKMIIFCRKDLFEKSVSFVKLFVRFMHFQPEDRVHNMVLSLLLLLLLLLTTTTTTTTTGGFWRPSMKPSGESWGDSRGTNHRILGAKPPIFHYISPRIPPRFPRRPPRRPPSLTVGPILGQFLLRKQMRNCHMTIGSINQVDCKPILNPVKAEVWLLSNKSQRTYLLIRRAILLDNQTLMYQAPALTCKKRIRIQCFIVLNSSQIKFFGI